MQSAYVQAMLNSQAWRSYFIVYILNNLVVYLFLMTVGPGFDDELWRIRQEVNKLKETLAMQSAYVQAMPNSQAMGNQAGLPTSFMSSMGVGGGEGGGVSVTLKSLSFSQCSP